MSAEDARNGSDESVSGNVEGESGASATELPREQAKPNAVDERKLEAPSRQTLILLGGVALSTLLMWGVGRAACNYHVPNEGNQPRTVTFEERTRHPKDVALEYVLALGNGRFEDAEKLSVDAALDYVKKDRESCGDCAARKVAKLFVTPSVTEANLIAGHVVVEATGGATPLKLVLRLEQRERAWKVTQVFGPNEALPPLPTPPPAASGVQSIPIPMTRP